MSLRTKLLAAVVGLNGAILLLALYLLLRSEPPAPAQPDRELLADLPGLGGAIVSDRDDLLRAQALELLDEIEAAGRLHGLLVVEEAGTDRDAAHRVWPAADFLASGPAADELDAGSRRDGAIQLFRRARRGRNRWVGTDRVALVIPSRLAHGGLRGLVAEYAVPPDPRSGIRIVYVVMVVGVILLTAVSFWLVSRLVIRPLDQLMEAADRIARGDYRIRVAREGTNDEFDRAKAAFNRMAGEIAEYQGHLEDRVLAAIRRVRKAEQHLTIAQRLAATGKLASGIAHEINNPLGGMKNAVRALARGDLDEQKTAQYLELVEDGLGRVEETVKKFLSFTPRRVEPRPTDLAEVARKALALARHRIDRSGATLAEELPEAGRAIVFGDLHELQQVTLNLLLNAADAVAAAGGASIAIRVLVGPDDVVLEVADDGGGLTPEDQGRCFDMFWTTKGVGEGTGLGLAVAHTIVTSHGGRIEVESAPGEGALFRVVLPAEPAPSEEMDVGLKA